MKKIFKFNSLIICFLLMFSLTSCKKIEIAEEFKEPIDVVTTTMKLDHWVYFANADDSGYLVYENNDYFTFELDSKYVSTSTKIILKSKPSCSKTPSNFASVSEPIFSIASHTAKSI